MGSWWQLVVIAGIVTGCSGGVRRNEVPAMAVPPRWHTAAMEGMHAGSPACFQWWQALNDPQLTALMQRAAERNRDLMLGSERIWEARGQRTGADAGLYPHLNGSVMAGHARLPKDALLTDSCSRHEADFFEMGFDAEWEIDLFGKKNHALDSLQYTLEAQQENLHDVWISLAAEIARNYLELRGYQQRLALLERNRAALATNVCLVERLLEIGMSDGPALGAAHEGLYVLRAQKPLLELALAKSVHRLGVLVGEEPGALACELAVVRQLPQLPVEKPVGIPAELLRRRPDIRRAERELAAAHANEESAAAEQWPTLTLRGFGGILATHGGALFSKDNVAWLAAPQLSIPLFNSQLPKQDVTYQAVKRQQARYRYEKTVLEALEEAENAIAALKNASERSQELAYAWHTQQQILSWNQDLYHQGLIDYRTVLVHESASLKAQESHLQSQIALLIDYVVVYKSLAGGWTF
jgi:NodT family efflux transporter outer membrane factor (OMF) lipoprotein